MLLTLALVGCVPQFNTVDDACVEDPNGTDRVSKTGAQAINRLNCHRRVAGLRKAPFRKGTCDATRAQASYMALNWDRLDLPTSEQVATLPGFVGTTLKDRLERKNVDVEGDFRFYEALLEFPELEDGALSLNPAEVVDVLIADPYVREFLLQPSIEAICYEKVDDIGVVDIMFEWPPGYRNNKPVTYPDDSQFEVPTSGIDWGWHLNDAVPNELSDRSGNYIPTGRATGFPISVMVADDEGANGGQTDYYNISVTRTVLQAKETGAAVEATTVVPDDTPGGLGASVIVLPTRPLSARTEYTLKLDMLYGGGDGKERQTYDLDMRFTTGDTTDLANPDAFPFVYAYGPF